MIPHRPGKGTYFVHGPYVKCPACGEEQFGVLGIYDRHYTRRCKRCTHDGRFLLPPLHKKTLYLDQFVISNVMKELDPASAPAAKGTNDGFYRKLFDRLDRVSKLQLLLCPQSSVQRNESVVDPRYEKLRRVLGHLSWGVGLHPPDTIFHAQLLRAFRGWLANQPPEPLERDFAFEGKFDIWPDRLRIEMNYTVPGLPEALRNIAAERDERMQNVCRRWQQAADFDFAKVLAGESRVIALAPWEEYIAYSQRFSAVEQGLRPYVFGELIPPPSASLVTHMLAALPRDDPARINRLQSFFTSPAAQSVPYVRVSALFWATLAREVRRGRAPGKFSGSLFNDVEVIAAYAPFCDAMFVDKEVAHLTDQPELKRELAGQARLFSLRKADQKAFFDYLAEIETSASPEHLAKVQEVYGNSWPQPYWEMLGGAPAPA